MGHTLNNNTGRKSRHQPPAMRPSYAGPDEMQHWGQDRDGMRPWASREEGRFIVHWEISEP